MAQVGRSNAALARYDGQLKSLVNPNVMLSTLALNEAVKSLRLEGTVTEPAEVYARESGESYIAKEKYNDLQEVINYRHAMIDAKTTVEIYPISLHLIRSLHKRLMMNVRGGDKNPGEFRTTQNWIGPKGCPIEKATYVPPSPVRLDDHLANFESLSQIENESLDPIIHAALVHAQFELIHPFDDGNGRIGRLLIPLLLHKRGMLSSPSLYMSDYFDAHEDQYKASLGAISAHDDWAGWTRFFLTAVRIQAEDNCERIDKLTDLYDDMKNRISAATHSQHAIKILDAIFNTPIFTSTQFIDSTGLKRATANYLLTRLKDSKILAVFRQGAGRRATLHIAGEIMDLIA